MARVRSPARDEAKKLYLESNGEIKLVDIATKLNILDSQVRKWKSQDKWEQELKGTLSKSKGSVTNKNLNNKSSKKESIADEVKEVLENTELTDKQRLFCVIYAKCMNATKAYQKAYKCTYETAMVEGSKSLRNPKIKNQIDSLIAAELNIEFLRRSLLQEYIDIAFSDMGEYVKFGKKTKGVWTKDNSGIDIPVIDPETGEQKIIEYNYMELNESSMVDTTLISEISEGKDGIKIKLVDKMKAMDFLSKHANLLNDEEKTKLEIEYKRLQNMKLGVEISKLKGDDLDIEDTTEIESEIYDN